MKNKWYKSATQKRRYEIPQPVSKKHYVFIRAIRVIRGKPSFPKATAGKEKSRLINETGLRLYKAGIVSTYLLLRYGFRSSSS